MEQRTATQMGSSSWERDECGMLLCIEWENESNCSKKGKKESKDENEDCFPHDPERKHTEVKTGGSWLQTPKLH